MCHFHSFSTKTTSGERKYITVSNYTLLMWKCIIFAGSGIWVTWVNCVCHPVYAGFLMCTQALCGGWWRPWSVLQVTGPAGLDHWTTLLSHHHHYSKVAASKWGVGGAGEAQKGLLMPALIQTAPCANFCSPAKLQALFLLLLPIWAEAEVPACDLMIRKDVCCPWMSANTESPPYLPWRVEWRRANRELTGRKLLDAFETTSCLATRSWVLLHHDYTDSRFPGKPGPFSQPKPSGPKASNPQLSYFSPFFFSFSSGSSYCSFFSEEDEESILR